MLLACSAVLGIGFLAVLLLNTVISQGAFRQFELELALIKAAESEEALAATVQAAEAPIEVERAARKLGMVPAAAPVFLRLADGAILGEPVPAPAPTGKVSFRDAPGILPTPKPTPAASASASAATGLDPALDPATGLDTAQDPAAVPAAEAATGIDRAPAPNASAGPDPTGTEARTATADPAPTAQVVTP